MTLDTAYKILIVEDDPKISRFIELELQCEGYEVFCALDGMEGLMQARTCQPDVVILDRMLPELDGMEVCKRLRQTSDVPIIMLTARNEFHDRVEGLDGGASDYLTKPFNLDELLARIRVQLRARKPVRQDILAFADLSLDLNSREVRRGQHPISLSPKEFELLCCLMKQPRHVVPRSRIYQTVWGWESEAMENVLDVCIHALRDKLETHDLPRLIHTVRGVGYVLREQP
ncbi:MAG TPA: response regulator transcription factor [Candidatus Obscuribacterales bacterium]